MLMLTTKNLAHIVHLLLFQIFKIKNCTSMIWNISGTKKGEILTTIGNKYTRRSHD